MKEQGVKLKVMWYGNPAGTELYDLDYATQKQLVDHGKAEYVEREVDAPAPEPVAAIEEAAEPGKTEDLSLSNERAMTAQEAAQRNRIKIFGK